MIANQAAVKLRSARRSRGPTRTRPPRVPRRRRKWGEGVTRGFTSATWTSSPIRPPTAHFAIHRIATTRCYRCVMLTLIFALAVRLLAHVAGAAAARRSHFPAVSLLNPWQGKCFPCRRGQGNWRNGLMSRQNFGLKGSISGRKRKSSLPFPGRQGKSPLAGLHVLRIFAAPPLARRPPAIPIHRAS